jgi:chromosome segregation ATPase
MAKDTFKNLTLILLLGITIFSMARYVVELRARFKLQGQLSLAQGEVSLLTQEKQNLLQELGKEKELNENLGSKNIRLKAYLGASKDRMSRLFQENAQLQDKLEDSSAKFAVLKAENRSLIDAHKRMYTENEEFKLKFNSVIELRKAIRELRTKKHGDLGLESEGNRGFLIKDGRLTSEKVKIQVTPIKSKE